jgi:hypothetical protein
MRIRRENMSLHLTLKECALLEQILVRFLGCGGNDDIRSHVVALQTKLRDEVETEEGLIWDTERLEAESPEL